MIDFYNAFISYRHAELDSKVAEHVQRSLEHFIVPGAIKKKTGKKRIERIFRDKDELPITSDLTDTISNALEKADYLIVICSHNTCESIWVEREINFFLKNHSKNKILTVLADGEPTEVIPKILQQDERVVKDEDGTERTIKVNIEPLSCDYRMPFNKAKKEEIPRLAAALLGCSYDELVRRQRAYKTRRLMIVSTVVAAAAIAFGTYMWIAKRRVDEALLQAQISKSKYLAGEAESLLDDERRIDGLYLALASVPENADDPRLVTSESIAALTRATAAYRGQAGNNVDCVWNYSVGSVVDSITVNTDGTRLAAVNNTGVVSVWNTEDHNKLYDIVNPDSVIQDVQFAGDDTLIVLGMDKVCAFDSDTGEQIWELGSDALPPQHSLYFTSFCDELQIVNDDRIMVFLENGTQIWLVDTADGDIIETYELYHEVNGLSYNLSNFRLSPDKTKIGFTSFMNMDEHYVGIYDLTNGNFMITDVIDEFVNDAIWYDDDHFVASSFDLRQMESMQFQDTYSLRPNYTDLYCYNPDDLSLMWHTVHTGQGMNLSRHFICLNANNMLGFYSGNTCTAYDIDTGDVLYNWNTSDSIVDASDRDGDGFPMLITTDGGMVFPTTGLGNDVVTLMYEFASDIHEALVNHGVYIVQESGKEIIYYNVGVVDDEWVQTDDVMTGSVDSYYLDDEVLALIYGSGDITLTLIDPDTNEVIRDVDLSAAGTYSFDYSILGVYDGDLVLIRNSDGMYLITVDIGFGTKKEIELSDNVTTVEEYFMYGDYVSFLYYDYPDVGVGIYNLDTGDTQMFPLPVDSLVGVNVAPEYYEELGVIYASTPDGDYIVRVEDGFVSRVELPNDWNGTVCLSADLQAGHFIVSDGKQILFIDDMGDTEGTIFTGGRLPLGFTVLRQHEEDTGILAVVYSEGLLCRYDPYTGELLGSSDVSTYADYVSEVEFTMDWDNRYLYLNMTLLEDVINIDSWVEEAYIMNCYGHHGPSDRFYTTAYELDAERSVGYFRHYNLEDLINKAREILGDNFEIPDYLRSIYGL